MSDLESTLPVVRQSITRASTPSMLVVILQVPSLLEAKYVTAHRLNDDILICDLGATQEGD